MNAIETKVFTAHVPHDLAQKVDAYAAQLDRSRGWVVKQALNDWVEQEEARNQLTLDALADSNAGLVVDHATVLAWANNLGVDNEVASQPK